MLKIEKLCYSYDKTETIKDISFEVEKGEFVGLIGPNGCGKSTILKNVYKSLSPQNGKIFIENKDISLMSNKETAKKIAVVNQENELKFDFTVKEIVSMGRSPYKKMFERDTALDLEIVQNSLEILGIDDIANKSFYSLSGGEKQRVIIARAIAQDTEIIVLDEPTNHLDINYQMQMFEFIKGLDVTVLTAIHDLNMASLFCDRLILLDKGRVISEGTPEEILTTKNIKEIFGIDTVIEKNEITKKNAITFLPESKKIDTEEL